MNKFKCLHKVFIAFVVVSSETQWKPLKLHKLSKKTLTWLVNNKLVKTWSARNLLQIELVDSEFWDSFCQNLSSLKGISVTFKRLFIVCWDIFKRQTWSSYFNSRMLTKSMFSMLNCNCWYLKICWYKLSLCRVVCLIV